MKIRNNQARGKWIFTNVNGYTEKVWVGAYATVNLPYVTRRDQLNLNAHEEAIEFVEEKFGIEVDNVEDLFQYTVSMTEGAAGGTTSLSATTLSVNEGLNTSFYIYPDSGYYISAYTINNVSEISAISNVSASTVTATISNVRQDKNLFVGFAAFGS